MKANHNSVTETDFQLRAQDEKTTSRLIGHQRQYSIKLLTPCVFKNGLCRLYMADRVCPGSRKGPSAATNAAKNQ